MSRTLNTATIALMVLVLFTLSSLASALEKQPFSEELLTKLQSEDQVVLVDVFATWCPTCAKQQKLLEKYRDKYPENIFHVLVIDYDKDRALVEKYNAPRQSTLILYKGDKQFWYSVAEKDYKVIERELNKAFKFKPKS